MKVKSEKDNKMTIKQIVDLVLDARTEYIEKNKREPNLILIPSFMYDYLLLDAVKNTNYDDIRKCWAGTEEQLAGMRVIPVMSKKIELFEEVK